MNRYIFNVCESIFFATDKATFETIKRQILLQKWHLQTSPWNPYKLTWPYILLQVSWLAIYIYIFFKYPLKCFNLPGMQQLVWEKTRQDQIFDHSQSTHTHTHTHTHKGKNASRILLRRFQTTMPLNTQSRAAQSKSAQSFPWNVIGRLHK